MTSYEQRLLDNPAQYVRKHILTDVMDSQTAERMLIYESTHRHRKTVERALIEKLKDVVHVEQKNVPTMAGLLSRRW